MHQRKSRMPNCTIYNSLGDKIAVFSTDPFSSNITIGRSSSCLICLKGLVDTAISREHLVLVKTPFGWKVHNNSRTGMYKNCVKIQDHALEEGDIIRFANLFLAFGNTAKPAPYDLSWEAETEDGTHRGVLWPGLNSVGASHDNYVMIRTTDISRIHAYIFVSGTRLTIKSATLANQTLVNGTEVGESEMELKPNSVIQLADTTVKLVSTVRYTLTEAPVQVAVKKEVALNNSDSVNNKNFMMAIIALFTLIVTIILFFAFRILI